MPRHSAACVDTAEGTSRIPRDIAPSRHAGATTATMNASCRPGWNGPCFASAYEARSRCTYRRIRLALRDLARRILPARAYASARARLREPTAALGGDQRLVLLAAAPVQLPALAGVHAG